MLQHFSSLGTVDGARTTTVTRIATRELWEPNHLLWTLPRPAAAGSAPWKPSKTGSINMAVIALSCSYPLVDNVLGNV